MLLSVLCVSLPAAPHIDQPLLLRVMLRPRSQSNSVVSLRREPRHIFTNQKQRFCGRANSRNRPKPDVSLSSCLSCNACTSQTQACLLLHQNTTRSFADLPACCSIQSTSHPHIRTKVPSPGAFHCSVHACEQSCEACG
jgi:hypothetical protein